MIVGVGLDAVEIARIARAVDRHPRFTARVFTPAEQEASVRRGVGATAYLAKRWAAKEAVSKALGVGFSGFTYTEIQVVNLPSGAPTVELSGELAGWAHSLGVLRWHLSLSDTREMAFATAVAEGPDDYPRRPPGPPPWVRRRWARQAQARPAAPIGGGTGPGGGAPEGPGR
jgi:holo-[acyl-carrier protein] synthase